MTTTCLLFSEKLNNFIKENYVYVEGTQFWLGQGYEVKLLKLKKPLPRDDK